MRRTILGVCAVWCVAATVACGGESEVGGTKQPEKLRTDVPDPPPGGVQIVSETFSIGAGEEKFICMRLGFEADEDLFIQRSKIYQVAGGHHTVVFYNPTNNTKGIDPKPHECNGFEMTDVRFATTGGSDGIGLDMPDGIVLTLPAGVQIWAQSHYINTTEEEMVVQDVINLETIEKSQVKDFASTFAHVDLTFTLPPNQETTRQMQCAMPRDMTIPWLLPHMHEWGLYFKLDVAHQGTSIYHWEGDWNAGFRDDFPIINVDPPLQVSAGDVLTTECKWGNSENTAMAFPQEMCVTFFPFYPGDGSLLSCDETGYVEAQ